ncbi:hypothetical protein HDU96_006599 [Phlyctochytrium bullatum]|nr:hypothetical protein HDU96_006599 [Phlyctochytrium bullatum]
MIPLLPPEVMHRVLLASGDLQAAIDYELLRSGIDRRFHFRIHADPEAGPVSDAVLPLFPDKWANLTTASFPVSLAISQLRFVVPHDDVATVPAFKVAWIAKFRPDLFTFEYVMKAARAGRLDLIRVLDAYRVTKFCKGTFDEAAAGGHLAVLQFLYRCGRYGGCSARAVDKAAEGGYLDVIKWLRTVRNAGCTGDALFYAARGGNLEVVEYLQKEMEQEPSSSSYYDTHAGGYLEVEFRVLRLLHEEFGWPLTSDLLKHVVTTGQPEDFCYCVKRIPHLVAGDVRNLFKTPKNWLRMLKSLHDFHGDNKEIWVDSNWDELANHGHADMLEFLYEHRREGCTKNGLESAAQRGHVHVVELLVAKGLDISGSLLLDAVLSNNVELLRFCRSLPQLEEFWSPALASYAAQFGRFESLSWLWEEMGVGLTRLDFSPIVDRDDSFNQHVNVALYAMQKKGLPVPEQPFFVGLLGSAVWNASLEQVEAISKLTTNECPEAFLVSAGQGRLDVLKLLCETRTERPSKECLEFAAHGQQFEVVRYLLDDMGVEPTVNVLRCAVLGGNLELVLRLVDRFPVDEFTDAPLLTDALFEGEIEIARLLHQRGHTILDEETAHEMFRDTQSLDIIDFFISKGYHKNMDLSQDLRDRTLNCFGNIDITERCFYNGGLSQSFVPGDFDFFDFDADVFEYNPDLIRFARAKRMLDLDRLDPFYHDALICFQLFVSWNLIKCNTATAERAAVEGAYSIMRWLSRRHPGIFKPRVMAKAITSRTSMAPLVVEFLLDNHLNCWDSRVHTKLVPGSKAVACLLAKRGIQTRRR